MLKTQRYKRNALLYLIIFWGAALFAQTGGIKGVVQNSEQEPITVGTAFLVELKKSDSLDKSGAFGFDNVPAGDYTLQIASLEYGNRLRRITVEAGKTAEIQIIFDIEVHDEVIVSATPERKSISDISLAVGVLTEDDLALKMQPTLGETLSQEPGVSSSYFGPGASRPIIRGLGGDRIRVLEGGIESGDASSVSADHAISVDTLTAERIEILRGPASLRYGSSAVGGVVNIVDNRIPEFQPSTAVAGLVELRGDTVADERGVGVNLTGGQNNLAWHADFSHTETDNYDIPGEPELEVEGEDHDEDHEEPFNGYLENSALEKRKGSVGFSYIGERGFVGVSYSRFDTDYGIPGHGHAHEHDHEAKEEEADEEEMVTIDLDQNRLDARGEYRLEGGLIKSLNLRFANTDYEHVELEGDEVGTRFLNDYRELRGEILHGRWGAITSGAIGVQYSKRDFEAIGEEAFVAPNQTEKYALFIYEEMDRGNWSLNFGTRYEHQNNVGSFAEHDHDHEDDHSGEEEGHEDEHEEAIEAFDINNNGVSSSIGMVLGKDTDYGFSANVTHTERAPTAEELFSNGPHLATSAFEVGDPTLDKESSLGLDLVFRKKQGFITGELSLFMNNFSDFIYERATGEEEDGLREFQYTQEDADFYGGELHLDFDLYHTEPHHLNLELTYDYVRAELDNGMPLPRITPSRLQIGLSYKQPSFWAKANVNVTDDQDRTADFETPTEGYTFLNAAFGYRFFLGGTVHQLLLRGSNLTDEEGRVHNSFLKDRVLLPGRNLTLSYRMNF